MELKFIPNNWFLMRDFALTIRVKSIQTYRSLMKVWFASKMLYIVNSVQEACVKCFAVHILKFEKMQIT